MSWILRAKAGDKVCLVNDMRSLQQTDWGAALDIEFPEVGVVYTIRDIVPSPYPDGAPGIRLAEILNLPCGVTEGGGFCEKPDDVAEIAFDYRDFRPVDRNETAMAVLESLLNTSKDEVPA